MLSLRQAEISDSSMLLEWANDPEVRDMSFSSGTIEWEEHDKWYRQKLSDPDTRIYIAIDERNEPLGQIRLESINRTEAEIHVHVKPGMRDRGIGTRLIELGVSRLFKQTDVNIVHARIKLNNRMSRRAFVKSGFEEAGKETFRGHECLHMIRKRDWLHAE